MSLPGAIDFFRAQHEAIFSSSVRITRSSIETTFDETTGVVTLPAPTLVYEGPGEVRERENVGSREVNTGEREVLTPTSRLRVPHDTDIQENDVVEVITSTHDADLPGAVYRITHVILTGWQVVRRAELERVAGIPAEADEESS